MVVALGGDGFMLQTLHATEGRDLPVYGMNRGTVGFLMNRNRNPETLLKRIGRAKRHHIAPLRMEATTQAGAQHTFCAINEVSLLRETRQTAGKQEAQTVLSRRLPKALAQFLCGEGAIAGPLAELNDKALRRLADRVHRWKVKPAGSEGYRTAEVTLGGIDTAGLDQKTMAAKSVPGLYFIGEAVDVTGWLGGYNFQWAWSSAWAAGQAV